MSLIHLLYPKKCPVCGSAKTADEKDVFCPDCYKNSDLGRGTVL